MACALDDVELLLADTQAVGIADQRNPTSPRTCEAAIEARDPIETNRPLVMIETTRQTDSLVCEWFVCRGYETPIIFDRGSYRNLIFSPQRGPR